jgi:hypothetical protein
MIREYSIFFRYNVKNTGIITRLKCQRNIERIFIQKNKLLLDHTYHKIM